MIVIDLPQLREALRKLHNRDNSHLLVSRNKREGWYCRKILVLDEGCTHQTPAYLRSWYKSESLRYRKHRNDK